MKQYWFSQRRIISRVGGILFLFFLSLAILANLIAPYPPRDRFEPYQFPGKDHLFGTNDIGNDIFSEFVYGSRASLLVGILTGVFSTILGVTVGMIAGFHGGWLDDLLMGMTDVVLMVPRIPLIIVLSAFLRPSIWLLIMVMGVLWWTSTARVIRSRTIQVRAMSFVESARCLGFSNQHIIFSEVLPNVMMIVIPEFLLTVASAMISEASLSFLGLGDPSLKSWGSMIHFAFQKGGFLNGMWWWYLPPGMGITLFVLSIVFISLSFEETEYEMKEEYPIDPFSN